MTRQQNAYACAAASVLLWSTVATAFKLSLRHMSPLQLLLWADVVSIGCLGGVLAVRKKFHLVTSCSAGELLRAAALGFLNPFLLNALKLADSAARVSTLIFFSPFLSLVFIRFFLGEDIRISTLAGLLFIIGGNVLQQTAGSKK